MAEGLSPAQVREYRILDNRSHQETDFDLDLVKLEMMELQALECDLKFTSFGPRKIDAFLAGAWIMRRRINRLLHLRNQSRGVATYGLWSPPRA